MDKEPGLKMPSKELNKRPEGTLAAPICFGCVHWVERTDTCKAFPDAIPHEIWGLGDYHKKPFPGDHGIQFKPL